MDSDAPASVQELERIIASAAQVFDRHRIRYALIGGVATGLLGRPRGTRDIDLILLIPQIALPGLLDDLIQIGFAFDRNEIIKQWTQEHMTVLRCRGVRVDWLKPILPLYQHVIDTAEPRQLQGSFVSVASPEGLILTKLIAFRPQDQLDIMNLLAANSGELDLDWIRREWATIADADDPKMRKFEEMVAEYYQT
jgi:hypothetical protein